MHSLLRSSSLVLPALLTVVALGALEGRAEAANFIVTNTGDRVDVAPGDGVCLTNAGFCSLRAAVMESNALAGADTITVSAGLGTISLVRLGPAENAAATGDLDIAESVTIVGNGVVIDGQGDDRIFHVLGGVPAVDISGVTLQNGWGDLVGGAIYNQGDLVLSSCVLTANAADHGGAIDNIGPGSLVVAGCEIHDNDAVRGGAIYSTSDLVIEDTTINLNDATEHGGGLYVSASTSTTDIIDSYIGENTATLQGGGMMTTSPMNLTDSTIQGNAAGTYGGGLYIYTSNAVVDAFQTDFVGNSASHGGGIYNFWAELSLRRAGVWGNVATTSGGGLYNQGILTAQRGAIYNNAAAAGAGIYSYSSAADMELYNMTFSGNSATGAGGGIWIGTSSLADFNNVTVVANTGTSGGLYAAGTTTMVNTIVGDNLDLAGLASDCVGSITSNGHNLIEDIVACAVGGPATADIYTATPALGALAFNGGQTPTHAVLNASPARNSGDNATCRPMDQRGVARPLGGTCDRGAFERN